VVGGIIQRLATSSTCEFNLHSERGREKTQIVRIFSHVLHDWTWKGGKLEFGSVWEAEGFWGWKPEDCLVGLRGV
jgi:hypothetical protein